MTHTVIRPDKYFDDAAERVAQQATVDPGVTVGERNSAHVYVRTTSGYLPVETGGAKHFYASAKAWENVNLGAGDQVVTITGGVAKGVYRPQAGTLLKNDTSLQAVYPSLPLQAGFNPMEITKIFQAGSVLVGSAAVFSW